MSLCRRRGAAVLVALFLPLAGACARGGSGAARPGAAQSPAPANPGPSAAADTAAGPGYVYRDSAEVFDPDGYYYPVDSLRLGEYLLEPLELHTVDYYYEGQVHHERPRVLVPPKAELGLTVPGREGIASSACVHPQISPDTLSLRCPATAVGDVTIEGRFLHRVRSYWDSPYNDDSTPVLAARVVVTRGGRVIHDAAHTFKFTSGD